MLEKPKLSFDIGSITIKANIELSGKETEKYPRNVFTIIIVWMVPRSVPFFFPHKFSVVAVNCDNMGRIQINEFERHSLPLLVNSNW